MTTAGDAKNGCPEGVGGCRVCRYCQGLGSVVRERKTVEVVMCIMVLAVVCR